MSYLWNDARAYRAIFACEADGGQRRDRSLHLPDDVYGTFE